MSTTKVQIANLALARLGAKRIDSFTENTREAELVAQVFDWCRDDILRLADWPIARKIVALALSGEAPEGWEYSYALPADCIMPRRIQVSAHPETPETTIHFELSAAPAAGVTLLWTNQDQAVLRYTARTEPAPNWPAAMASLVAWAIACELVVPVTENANLEAWCRNRYAGSRAEALAEFAASEKLMQPRSGYETARGV